MTAKIWRPATSSAFGQSIRLSKSGITVPIKSRTFSENSENMYRFTKLAIELNEEEEGVAPTDSRLRRDQRIMEQQNFDEANIVKEGKFGNIIPCYDFCILELEEKQRANRRQREQEVEQAMQKGLSYPEYAPCWFDKSQDEFTGSVVHIFKSDYWQCKDKQDWSRCPSIF
jgi:hypothetical protein